MVRKLKTENRLGLEKNTLTNALKEFVSKGKNYIGGEEGQFYKKEKLAPIFTGRQKVLKVKYKNN